MSTLDKKLIFSEDQAITSTGDTDSTDVYNSEVTRPEVGGKAVLEVTVDTAFTSGGAGTLAVSFQDSANGSSWRVNTIQTRAFALDELVEGARLVAIPLPFEVRQYMKVVYTVATAAMTGGTVNARIVTLPDLSGLTAGSSFGS